MVLRHCLLQDETPRLHLEARELSRTHDRDRYGQAKCFLQLVGNPSRHGSRVGFCCLDLDFDGQRPKRAVRLNAGAVLNDLPGGAYHRLDGAGVDVDAAYADHVVHSREDAAV